MIAEDGDVMTAAWERTDDGSKWRHWMDMTFTRHQAGQQGRAGSSR